MNPWPESATEGCDYGFHADNDFYWTMSDPDADDPAHRDFGFTLQIADGAYAHSRTTLFIGGPKPGGEHHSGAGGSRRWHGHVTATGKAALIEIAPSGEPPLGFDITVECLEITDSRD